jgi:hypothetical protein
LKELFFEFAFVKTDAALSIPRESGWNFLRYCVNESLLDKALDGVSQKIPVDYVSVPLLGEVEKHFCAEAVFDIVVENLVERLKSSDT